MCYFRPKRVKPAYNMKVYVTKRIASSFPDKTGQCTAMARETERTRWVKNTLFHLKPRTGEEQTSLDVIELHCQEMKGVHNELTCTMQWRKIKL